MSDSHLDNAYERQVSAELLDGEYLTPADDDYWAFVPEED